MARLSPKSDPSPPTLTPCFKTLPHSRIPLRHNPTRLSQTVALVDVRHVYNTFLQQGLMSGGYVQVTANESYLNENAPSDVLNPSVAPIVQIYVQHNFLKGFGTGVNSRFIRVAKKGVLGSNETFHSQLLNLVSNVLNLYWDLVSDLEDLKARRQTLEISKKFYEDTKKEIEIGAIAKVDIYRAEAEFNTRLREQAISLATIQQQENLLKVPLAGMVWKTQNSTRPKWFPSTVFKCQTPRICRPCAS